MPRRDGAASRATKLDDDLPAVDQTGRAAVRQCGLEKRRWHFAAATRGRRAPADD